MVLSVREAADVPLLLCHVRQVRAEVQHVVPGGQVVPRLDAEDASDARGHGEEDAWMGGGRGAYVCVWGGGASGLDQPDPTPKLPRYDPGVAPRVPFGHYPTADLPLLPWPVDPRVSISPSPSLSLTFSRLQGPQFNALVPVEKLVSRGERHLHGDERVGYAEMEPDATIRRILDVQRAVQGRRWSRSRREKNGSDLSFGSRSGSGSCVSCGSGSRSPVCLSSPVDPEHLGPSDELDIDDDGDLELGIRVGTLELVAVLAHNIHGHLCERAGMTWTDGRM